MAVALQRVAMLRNQHRPGTAQPHSRPKSAARVQRPQSAAQPSKAALQQRVNQLEAMLDLQRNEYKERVERWDKILNENGGGAGADHPKPGQLKSLEDYVEEEERRERQKKGTAAKRGKQKKERDIVASRGASRGGPNKGSALIHLQVTQSPKSAAIVDTHDIKVPLLGIPRDQMRKGLGTPKSCRSNRSGSPNPIPSGRKCEACGQMTPSPASSIRRSQQLIPLSPSQRSRSSGRSPKSLPRSPGQQRLPFGHGPEGRSPTAANRKTPLGPSSSRSGLGGSPSGDDAADAAGGGGALSDDPGGPRERPRSAAPVRNRWIPSASRNRPRTAPGMGLRLAEQDESYGALQNLQAMFKKVFEENQILGQEKVDAEQNLREFLSTTEGHQAKQILEQRDQVKTLRHRIYTMEEENHKATVLAKRYRRKATEEQMFLKQCFKEIETLKEVTLELQRINLEISESPQMKLIEQKLYKFQKGLTKRTKEMAKQNEKHEDEVRSIWNRVDQVNQKVEDLYKMTEQLKEDRAEAGKLLKTGKEKIKDCRRTLQNVEQDVQKLKQKAQDSLQHNQKLVQRQDEESAKVSALKNRYKEILEELVGNNKWYKRQNKELEEENGKLKQENTELLESLMAYLMLNQQSRFLKGPAKKALDPLTKRADQLRVPEPAPNENEDDDAPEDREPSLATQPYPLAEPVNLPPPPDPEFMSPRVLLEEKKVPLLLGEIVDVKM